MDKLTIAALEVTLDAYRRGALDEIPSLRMIRMSTQEIHRRASAFAENLHAQLPNGAGLEICSGFSVIGGGSTPDQKLPTTLLAVRSAQYSASQLEEKLRKLERHIPVIARIEKKTLMIDLRTVFEEEEPALAAALADVLV